MSRRRKAAKRAHLPDARYGSPLISQLINVVMKSGKKSIAQGIVYGAIEKVSEKLMKGNPVELMLGALENCRPKLEVKSRRVGGAPPAARAPRCPKPSPPNSSTLTTTPATW
ncbi:MAG: hypothetical protein RL515_209 [Verrucomicrobiota bacterium]